MSLQCETFDQPWPFVGANNFDVGRRIGFIAGQLSGDPVRLAVVYSGRSPGIYGERELVEMGITACSGTAGAKRLTQLCLPAQTIPSTPPKPLST
jgi:hypothetical protein